MMPRRRHSVVIYIVFHKDKGIDMLWLNNVTLV